MYSLKIVLRNLFRSKLYTLINIVGLSVSLVAVVFIVLWVKDELSYDRFHKDADNIYLTIAHFKTEGEPMSIEVSTGLFAPTAEESFDEVEAYCRTRDLYATYIMHNNVKLYNVKYLAVDTSFFSFFNFPILQGQKENVLQNPSNVVISQSLAARLFAGEDPIGKTIELGNAVSLTVAAVMQDMPHNSILPESCDMVTSFASGVTPFYSEIANSWGSCEFLSFLRIKPGTDINALAKRVTEKQTQLQGYRWFTLQPLVNMHLYTVTGEPSGIKTVRLFLIIAVAILIIACINYVNLVTARSTRRIKEVGVRKIMGGRRSQIFTQHILEAVVLFVISIALAIVLVYLLLPVYSQLVAKPVSLSWFSADIWLIFGGMLVLTTLLAGLYPAFILSSFSPLAVMQKGTFKSGFNALFRKVLIVVQFACSVILIIASITLSAQMKFIRQTNLGFDREYVFYLPLYNMAEQYESVKAELLSNPSVVGVSYSHDNPMTAGSTHAISDWDGKTTEGSLPIAQIRCDTAFIKLMGMTFAEGKGFSYNPRREYVLNESAIAAMGMDNPVGKRVYDSASIAGVVKDFHFASMHTRVTPLMMFFFPPYFYANMYVRTTGGNAADAVAAVEKLWKQYNLDYEFTYSFMDEDFERMYRSDQQTGSLFSIFAVIAIFTSCLGLFGLATYAAETRTKEIGIRKALGASEFNIITLLSKEFLLLVGVAVIIAFPLAYYLLTLLLQSYVYHVPISLWIFILAALVILVLTIATVSGQALKSAKSNPVKAIKTE